jgi:hypothetical protein
VAMEAAAAAAMAAVVTEVKQMPVAATSST